MTKAKKAIGKGATTGRKATKARRASGTTVTQPQTTTNTTTTPLAERNEKGQFVAGVSGNPNGRPKGKRNQITNLKQDLEIAVRENMSPERVQAVVDAMFAAAIEGNVGAGKLLLDKVLSNAKEADDEKDVSGGLKIVIEHANLDVLPQTHTTVIESSAEEIDNE